MTAAMVMPHLAWIVAICQAKFLASNGQGNYSAPMENNLTDFESAASSFRAAILAGRAQPSSYAAAFHQFNGYMEQLSPLMVGLRWGDKVCPIATSVSKHAATLDELNSFLKAASVHAAMDPGIFDAFAWGELSSLHHFIAHDSRSLRRYAAVRALWLFADSKYRHANNLEGADRDHFLVLSINACWRFIECSDRQAAAPCFQSLLEIAPCGNAAASKLIAFVEGFTQEAEKLRISPDRKHGLHRNIKARLKFWQETPIADRISLVKKTLAVLDDGCFWPEKAAAWRKLKSDHFKSAVMQLNYEHCLAEQAIPQSPPQHSGDKEGDFHQPVPRKSHGRPHRGRSKQKRKKWEAQWTRWEP